VTVKKTIHSARWILLFLLILGIGGTVAGEEPLRMVGVNNGFNLQADLNVWAEKTASYQLYTSGDGLALRLYTGFDRDYLYLGFAVKDPYLTFQDDYSLEFQQSDHLRVSIFPSAGGQEPVTLYLLPTSKIKEPLFHLSGGSLHRRAVKIHSVLNKDDYFLAVALSLDELGLTPKTGTKLPLMIVINDLGKDGELRKLSVFPNDGYGFLAF